MRKMSRGTCKSGEGCSSAVLDFESLAEETCPGPLYIAIHVGSDISFRNEALSCFDTRMREVVEGVKNCTTKSLWHKRSWFTS